MEISQHVHYKCTFCGKVRIARRRQTDFLFWRSGHCKADRRQHPELLFAQKSQVWRRMDRLDHVGCNCPHVRESLTGTICSLAVQSYGGMASFFFSFLVHLYVRSRMNQKSMSNDGARFSE